MHSQLFLCPMPDHNVMSTVKFLGHFARNRLLKMTVKAITDGQRLTTDPDLRKE